MSNGRDLGVSRSIEILQALRQTAATFSKKEDQLSRDLKVRLQDSNRRYRDMLSASDSWCQARVSETEMLFSKEKERIRLIYERRQVRVQRYQVVSLRNLPREAHEVKERWIGDLQMRKYAEERKLKADLAAADLAYANASSKLNSYQDSLADLESRARKAFRGYPALRRLWRIRARLDPVDAMSLGSRVGQIDVNLQAAKDQLAQFSRLPVPRFFSVVPLPVVLCFVIALGGVHLWCFGAGAISAGIVASTVLVLGGGTLLLHQRGRVQAKRLAAAFAEPFVEARTIFNACKETIPLLASGREQEERRVQEAHASVMDEIQQQWSRAGEVEAEFAHSRRQKLETQVPRIYRKIEAAFSAKSEKLDSDMAERLELIRGEATARTDQAVARHDGDASELATEEVSRWNEIESDWQRAITPVYETIDAMTGEANLLFPTWDSALIESWNPPARFISVVKFGTFDMDLSKQPALLPKSPRLSLPGPAKVSVPAALSFPSQGSLLFETSDSGDATVIGTLNNIVLRLLATTPPGKLSFTIVDPVGLGQNFAGLMYLSDYQETLINRHIWTQRDQIEERLADLSQHIEKVIQMYLRNEYATITEYNEQAGSVAEKYLFLVVADFPANFSETAAKRLQSIATSGARCGVFTLIHWDQRLSLPDGFVPDELRKNSVCVKRAGKGFVVGKEQVDIGASLTFETPPASELEVDLVHKIGKSSIDANRVEVPFRQVAPKPDEMWKGDTTKELRIAVGRTGATKLQYLALGKGTRQHALFAGKTGSGKSTLFHVIITNLALTCSPEQVEFYLIDFKKGVEFKCYATKHLPHAKVVAIESDREFALSVLQRVDGELRRRGDLFRKLGVQDLPGYKRAGGTEPMPRTLLIIDEFQEFFVEDDAIAQSASLLFDRIVRQGRAFGIHVLLGSQTLGGAYSLARATLGQMAIRVALQCNEADSYLIMDESNSAPRLLSRPGEGIYNDCGGAVEGNSPFQVVWLPDDERDQWLDTVHELAEHQSDHSYPAPVVFEGNAPADVRDNNLLDKVLEGAPERAPSVARCWLGAPNSIKGPTEIAFQRQSGSNLLMIGQRGETEVTLLALSMLALAAQFPRGGAKFVVFQSGQVDSSELTLVDRTAAIMPQETRVLRNPNVSSVMSELAGILQQRAAGEGGSDSDQAMFLCIHGLQKFKQLRHEDEFSFSAGDGEGANPGRDFAKIVTEGSSHGIHIIATTDSFNNVNHFLSRKALTEFAMRIVFQMSANDSSSLIDSPQASNLGLHRAIYYNEQESYLETFRPYAVPDGDWLAQAGEKLNRRVIASLPKVVPS